MYQMMGGKSLDEEVATILNDLQAALNQVLEDLAQVFGIKRSVKTLGIDLFACDIKESMKFVDLPFYLSFVSIFNDMNL